jgi:hypothetical protein
VTASTSSGPLKATHTRRCSGSVVTSLQQGGVLRHGWAQGKSQDQNKA